MEMDRTFEGRRVMVTGGSSGIGLSVALDLHQAGAEVIIVTRSQPHYFDTLKGIQGSNPGFDGERVYPFITDLSDLEQTSRAVEKLQDQHLLPTDIVHAAAGGMEPFLRELATKMLRLRRVAPENREEAFATFVTECDQWVSASQDFASAINYTGSRHLIESLADKLPRRGVVVYESSLWSTFMDQVWVPRFYQGVASSKGMFERWLESESGLEDREIYTAVVSGHIVMDTEVGKALNRLVVPLWPEADQAAISASFITKADMVKATRMALKGDDFDPKQFHRRLYVYGPAGVSFAFSPQSLAFSSRLPI